MFGLNVEPGSVQGPVQRPPLSSSDKNLQTRLKHGQKHKIRVTFDLQQFFHNKFVNASRRGSREEEGQGDEKRARSTAREDAHKQARLALVRQRRGWWCETHPSPTGRARWPGQCVGNPKQRMCVIPGGRSVTVDCVRFLREDVWLRNGRY